MLLFLLLAGLLSVAPVLAFAVLRQRVARWPWPGLWWLGLGVLALVAVLQLAKGLL